MILNWHCFYKNYCCSSCTGIMSLYFCIVGICCAVVRMSPRSFNRMISYLKLCMSCSTNNTCLRSATYHHIILGTKAVQRKLTLVIVILLFCQFLRTHSLARFTGWGGFKATPLGGWNSPELWGSIYRTRGVEPPRPPSIRALASVHPRFLLILWSVFVDGHHRNRNFSMHARIL